MATPLVAETAKSGFDFGDYLKKYGTLVALLLAIVFFAFATPAFFNVENGLNVLRQVSITALIAYGMTLVVIGGTFDLSAGSVCGLCAVCVALFLREQPWVVAMLMGTLVGLVIGIVNAFAIVKLRLSGIVTTLAMYFIAWGMEYLFSGGGRILNIDLSLEEFAWFGRGLIGPIPVPVVLMLIIGAIFYVFTKHTKPGRYMYAIGDNPMTAIMSGININKYVGLSFALCGLMAGFGGVMWASRIGTAVPGSAQVFLLDSIAAVYIGATIKSEGKPHIIGTLLGAIFMGIVTNGTSMMGFTVASQNIFKGCVLLAAVLLTAVMQKREIRTNFS